MPDEGPFSGRQLRVGYWQVDARLVDIDKVRLEKALAQLGASLTITVLKNLEALAATPLDLLIIAGQGLAEEDFSQWLGGLRGRMRANNGIWCPALILAELPMATLRAVMAQVFAENWYFDILAPEHLSSLPIRVANLLRMHDHLHEIKRYAEALESLSSRLSALEDEVKRLQSGTMGEQP